MLSIRAPDLYKPFPEHWLINPAYPWTQEEKGQREREASTEDTLYQWRTGEASSGGWAASPGMVLQAL